MEATLVNGVPTDLIPVSDRGFQYGDGVFETIRIADHRPTLWSLHRQRLLAGCEFLRISLQLDLLEQELEKLLEVNAGTGIVKITLTRGSGGRGYQPPVQTQPRRILQFFPLPQDFEKIRDQGARVKLCDHPLSVNSELVQYKHLCRIDQVIASAELSESFAEGIMQTGDGQIVEGTKSNLFLVQEQQLSTPCLKSAGIRGVMRECLLNKFTAKGIDVRERPTELADLLSANELFLCNSVFGVWPVTELVHGKIVKPFQVGHTTKTAIGFADEVFAA